MDFETAMQDKEPPPGAAVSRRECLTRAAAAMGYTLAAGPVWAQAIKTGTEGLSIGTATIKVSGGEMPVYFAKPLGAEKPPIILVAMEVFGLHEHIKDVTRRLAKLGALAVAPDYYFRLGDLTKITEPSQLMPLVNSKPDQELFLRSRRHRRLGAIARRRSRPARDHRLLPGRADRLALCNA